MVHEIEPKVRGSRPQPDSSLKYKDLCTRRHKWWNWSGPKSHL